MKFFNIFTENNIPFCNTNLKSKGKKYERKKAISISREGNFSKILQYEFPRSSTFWSSDSLDDTLVSEFWIYHYKQKLN